MPSSYNYGLSFFYCMDFTEANQRKIIDSIIRTVPSCCFVFAAFMSSVIISHTDNPSCKMIYSVGIIVKRETEIIVISHTRNVFQTSVKLVGRKINEKNIP